MKFVLRLVWGTLKVFHTVAASILLVLIFIVILGSLGSAPPIHVPTGAAMVFAPQGILVEQARPIDVGQFIDDGGTPEEIVLREAQWAIEKAKDDARITHLLLDLDGFLGGGPAALHALGRSILRFKESGKPVIAVGDAFTQPQYYLAAHADEIWMHPFGSVLLTGYGIYSPFFASALDKLRAKVHVFRVGTYKSAVEPFIRDDMSEEAKVANRAFLNVLWDRYLADVTELRGFAPGALEQGIAEVVARAQAQGGDLALLALEEGMVDSLRTRSAAEAALVERIGAGAGGSYKAISYEDYFKATGGISGGTGPEIAVVTLRGTIVPGEAPENQIGSENAVRLIDKARDDESVAALVVRIDSPGGSAFASEVIRQALEEVQEAGKPVIVSMASVAASGGYWISATADEIWAMPETITGSIGIFGLFITIEDSLDAVGIHSDGVGTTHLSGAFDPMRDLPESASDLIQASVEDGYRKFLSLVAEGRGMSEEEVDRIGQGRVWAGTTAKELGLVDEFGGLADAIESAARRAELEPGRYRVRHLKEPLSQFQRVLKMLAGEAEALGLVPERAAPPMPSIEALARRATAAIERLAWLRDPGGVFALCLACETP